MSKFQKAEKIIENEIKYFFKWFIVLLSLGGLSLLMFALSKIFPESISSDTAEGTIIGITVWVLIFGVHFFLHRKRLIQKSNEMREEKDEA